MIVSALRKSTYVRFAEIGAKSPVLDKTNIVALFNRIDNQCFTLMNGCKDQGIALVTLIVRGQGETEGIAHRRGTCRWWDGVRGVLCIRQN